MREHKQTLSNFYTTSAFVRYQSFSLTQIYIPTNQDPFFNSWTFLVLKSKALKTWRNVLLHTCYIYKTKNWYEMEKLSEKAEQLLEYFF